MVTFPLDIIENVVHVEETQKIIAFDNQILRSIEMFPLSSEMEFI